MPGDGPGAFWLEMAVLTTRELALMRREIGEGVVPITWDKAAINAALQGSEDVLEAQAFDATTFVTVTVTNNAEAQVVQDALDTGRYAANAVPLARFYLREHPASVSRRSVDRAGIGAFVQANQADFVVAVSRMPNNRRRPVVRAVIKRRVEAAV